MRGHHTVCQIVVADLKALYTSVKVDRVAGRPCIAVAIVIIRDRQVLIRNSVGKDTTSFAKAKVLVMRHKTKDGVAFTS